MSQQIKTWLQDNGFGIYPVHFCEEYKDKLKLAQNLNVAIMIDDKMQVLQSFPDTICKLWFCQDVKKIEGAKKY